MRRTHGQLATSGRVRWPIDPRAGTLRLVAASSSPDCFLRYPSSFSCREPLECARLQTKVQSSRRDPSAAGVADWILGSIHNLEPLPRWVSTRRSETDLSGQLDEAMRIGLVMYHGSVVSIVG
jgi:hypothetical protein